MTNQKKPLFMRVSKYTLKSLLNKSDKTLSRFEAQLFEEARRAALAHRWIRGVINLKKIMEGKNHE